MSKLLKLKKTKSDWKDILKCPCSGTYAILYVNKVDEFGGVYEPQLVWISASEVRFHKERETEARFAVYSIGRSDYEILTSEEYNNTWNVDIVTDFILKGDD